MPFSILRPLAISRADVIYLADAQSRPLDAEEVADLPGRRVFLKVVLDRALDFTLAQKLFERLFDLLRDGSGFRGGSVEGRDFAADCGVQLLVREPDEVVEGDGHVPSLFDDREGDDGLVGLAVNLIA